MLSGGKKDRENVSLPGSPSINKKKPVRIDYYDVFYFESMMRDMIEQTFAPIRNSFTEDKEAYQVLRYDYDIIVKRLHELEQFALIKSWQTNPSKAIEELLRPIEIAQAGKLESPTRANPKVRISQLPSNSGTKSILKAATVVNPSSQTEPRASEKKSGEEALAPKKTVST